MAQPVGTTEPTQTLDRPETPEPPYAFISYRRDDVIEVIGLRGELLSLFPGNRFWMDNAELRAGRPFAADLERGIRESSVVLVAIGQGWITRIKDLHDASGDFVRKEIQWALEAGKPIIPVMLDTEVPPVMHVGAPEADRATSVPAEIGAIFDVHIPQLTKKNWTTLIRGDLVPALEDHLVPSFLTTTRQEQARKRDEDEAARQRDLRAAVRRRKLHYAMLPLIWLVLTAFVGGAIHMVKSSITNGLLGAGAADVVVAAVLAALPTIGFHLWRRRKLMAGAPADVFQ